MKVLKIERITRVVCWEEARERRLKLRGKISEGERKPEQKSDDVYVFSFIETWAVF